MVSSSPLDRLVYYIYAVIAVVLGLVALNAMVNYKLKTTIQALESDIVAFHVPAISILDRMLIELNLIQTLPVDYSDAGSESRHNHVYLFHAALRELAEFQPQQDSSLTRKTLDRLESKSMRLLGAEQAAATSSAADIGPLRITVEQLKRLHVQEISGLERALAVAHREQAIVMATLVLTSLLIGAAIIFRILRLTRQAIAARHAAETELTTYRDHLEQLVHERTEELRKANEEMASFSYSVAHDLRAPLRAMDGFSKLLGDEYAESLDQQGQDFIRRIRNGARHMSSLIEGLLRLSRLSRQDLTLERVDLEAMARDVITSLRETVPQQQIELRCNVPAVVYADRALLRLALDNLLGNAVKYSRDQPVSRVQLESRVTPDGIVYSVSDNGVGFDMTLAGKLFGIFERLHGSHEYEGIGIGLVTVRRIVERHGGHIWAESTPGEGATFHFTLGVPRQESAPAEERAA